MLNYKACIFDLDGTVLDSMGVWRRVDEIFLGKRGLPLTDEYCKALSSMKLDIAAGYTVSLFDLKESPADIIKEWLDLAREEFTYKIGTKPFAVEYLAELKKRKIPAAVATTSQKELYLPALKRLKILDCFDVIVDSDTVNCGKNRPDIFLKAAEKLKTKPEDCIVFEDTVEGIRSAREAGFFTVGFFDESLPQQHIEISQAAHTSASDFKMFWQQLQSIGVQ